MRVDREHTHLKADRPLCGPALQVRYTFVIPRLKELQPASLSGPALHLGAIACPVTPLPSLLRYLQPKSLGQNEESVNIKGYDTTFLSRTTRKMITL